MLKRETKKNILDHLEMEGIQFSGRMGDLQFLERLYRLQEMESHDGRYENAYTDIWQHTINNNDYEGNWVFNDDRFELLDGPDEQLLRFLCEMAHPLVRADKDEANRIVTIANDWLQPEGWELYTLRQIAGGGIFSFRAISGTFEPLPSEIELNRIWTANKLRLFISHRDVHKAEVKKLAAELERYGISSFVAHDSIGPMREWKNEILKALKSMDAFLCYITNDFYASVWTNQEVGFAIAKGIPLYLYSADRSDPKGFKLDIQAIKTGKFELVRCIKDDFAKNKTLKKALIQKFIDAQETSFDIAKNAFYDLVGLEFVDDEIDTIVEAITAKTKSVNKLVVSLVDQIKDEHSNHPLLRKYKNYNDYLQNDILSRHSRKTFTFEKTGTWTYVVKEQKKRS